jgi:uncharacterized protein
MPVDEKVLTFIDTLRDAGLQVSIAESMDAFEALKVVPMDRIGPFRLALRSTLVKNELDFPLFEVLFDEFFVGMEAMLSRPEEAPDEHGDRDGMHATGDIAELSERIRLALAGGDAEQIAALARAAAAAVGQMEGGFGGGSRPLAVVAGSGYYIFKGMDMLDFTRMTSELQRRASEGELAGDVPPVLASEQMSDNVEAFRRAFEREIRRLLALERGAEAARRRDKLPARPEEIDFMNASLRQVEDMRRVLPVLARKLAARIARRQAAGRSGRVDIRNTLRHSISSGGVPIDVKYKKRVPSKPELWVLCDVSGSVRTFSDFTLQLVYSLHQQFKAVRSFVFIDRIDEVTSCFDLFDLDEAVQKVYRQAVVVDGDGHSDIGRVLDMFNREYAPGLGPRSTVLILSDARNNARDPRAAALERISKQARKVFWLNPEPRDRWDTGDSVIGSYEGHCAEVTECRNLKQLADFVYFRA